MNEASQVAPVDDNERAQVIYDTPATALVVLSSVPNTDESMGDGETDGQFIHKAFAIQGNQEIGYIVTLLSYCTADEAGQGEHVWSDGFARSLVSPTLEAAFVEVAHRFKPFAKARI